MALTCFLLFLFPKLELFLTSPFTLPFRGYRKVPADIKALKTPFYEQDPCVSLPGRGGVCIKKKSRQQTLSFMMLWTSFYA
ncbi:hypothetical protein RRG08_035373 [Elysia crispata]|uniref:Uncharacterized protein n=1 Tax=Elysia crispata TaxID=231223 RepID=A0AAE0Y3V1_9GAST|nr:hypothetical protein RRG08_035373 [Elysia crispata]